MLIAIAPEHLQALVTLALRGPLSDAERLFVAGVVDGANRQLDSQRAAETPAPAESGPYAYTATYQSGSSSATYAAGGTEVNYGASGQGFLFATADQSGAPFYSVRTHAGSPWSAQTEVVRLGNLRDAYGVGANNRYGIGLGDFSAGNYLLYNPTDGFVLFTG